MRGLKGFSNLLVHSLLVTTGRIDVGLFNPFLSCGVHIMLSFSCCKLYVVGGTMVSKNPEDNWVLEHISGNIISTSDHFLRRYYLGINDLNHIVQNITTGASRTGVQICVARHQCGAFDGTIWYPFPQFVYSYQFRLHCMSILMIMKSSCDTVEPQCARNEP